MDKKKILICLTFFFVSMTTKVEAQKKIVCYWYPGISTSQIDVNICTHIIFSFIGITSNGGITYLDRGESATSNFLQQATTQLRSQNSNLKILVAVGGWDLGAVNTWSDLAKNPTARSNFANNIFNFIQRFNLNGVDIDWEYPNMYGDRPEDKQNFITFLQTIKQRLGTQYSLSIAIAAGSYRTGLAYDVPSMFATVDFVNLMTYDMHGGWEGKTGLHSALYRSSLDNTAANVDESVKLLIGKGVDRNKIIVGIPAYGYAFQLQNSNNNGIGAPAQGVPAVPYRTICQRLNAGSLKSTWDNQQKTPYAVNGYEWISYDDVRSVIEKANYINNNGLGGAMFWAIDNDDYDGSCGTGRYPLISRVSQIVKGTITTTQSPVVSTTTTTTAQRTTTITTRSPGGGAFVCPGTGLWKDPTNCAKFYNCANGFAYSQSCGSGLLWNDKIKSCDWPANVVC